MKLNFGPIFGYIKAAFSDNGSPSSSRLLTAVHSSVACGALIYIISKTHTLPDAATLTGLGAFSTAHYAVNRITNAWGTPNAPKPDVVVAPQTSVPPSKI